MSEASGVPLVLYVANDGPRSVVAADNIKLALAKMTDRAFSLEIVNVYDDADRALRDHVIVTPTLLAPQSSRRLVGDLSQESHLNYFLRGLPEKAH